MGRHKVPADVKRSASKALQLKRAGFKGGTQTGWGRARQLVNCEYITDTTIKTMKAWYARHTYTSYPGYKKWVRDGKPSVATTSNKNSYRGAVAWLLWGGDEAKKWLDTISL